MKSRKGCVEGTSLHKSKYGDSSPIKLLGGIGTLMALKSDGTEEAQTFARENTLMGKLFSRGNSPSNPAGPSTDPINTPMAKKKKY